MTTSTRTMNISSSESFAGDSTASNTIRMVEEGREIRFPQIYQVPSYSEAGKNPIEKRKRYPFRSDFHLQTMVQPSTQGRCA